MTDPNFQSSPLLEQILVGNLCCGCGLCATIANDSIEMCRSRDGFLRPRQTANLDASFEELLKDVCPALSVTQPNAGLYSDLIWGPYFSVAIGAATQAKLRHHGSSGAALSAMLNLLIDEGLVERIVQTTASKEYPLECETSASENANQIYNAAGSRYAPSAPLAMLSAELERPGRIALVGKPCDVAAARAWVEKDPSLQARIPFMLSFFCAGVPSTRGARQLCEEMGITEDAISQFRYRGDGWPGRATAYLKNGEQKSLSYKESWGAVLSKHVQFRCKICPDGTGGSADIVCADAWHSDEYGYPILEEQEGQSLIIARTKVGYDLLVNSVAKGYLHKRDIDIAEINKMQPSQLNRKTYVFSRLVAMAILLKKRPDYKGFCLKKSAYTAGIRANIKNLLGMLKRLIVKDRKVSR